MVITHMVDAHTAEQSCEFRFVRNGETFVLLPHTYTGPLKLQGLVTGIWIKTMAGRSNLLEDSIVGHRFGLSDRVHRVTLSVKCVAASSATS